MRVNITPIEQTDVASPSLWNNRYGQITSAINGNLDSDNLADGAVTKNKIAQGAVTSDKLGFKQYTDDNGWLVTDLGLVKLATKKRTFKTASTDAGAVAFVAWNDGMLTNPVGFNPNAPFNMVWSISGDGNVGKWTFNAESGVGDSPVQPNTTLVQHQNYGGPEVRNFVMHTWVIF